MQDCIRYINIPRAHQGRGGARKLALLFCRKNNICYPLIRAHTRSYHGEKMLVFRKICVRTKCMVP